MYEVYLDESIPIGGQHSFDCEEEPIISDGVIIFKVEGNRVVVPLYNLKCVIVAEGKEDE